MEYYETLRKNKIMQFTATGMKLKDIMLSEIGQRKGTDTECSLYVGSKDREQGSNKSPKAI